MHVFLLLPPLFWGDSTQEVQGPGPEEGSIFCLYPKWFLYIILLLLMLITYSQSEDEVRRHMVNALIIIGASSTFLLPWHQYTGVNKNIVLNTIFQTHLQAARIWRVGNSAWFLFMSHWISSLRILVTNLRLSHPNQYLLQTSLVVQSSRSILCWQNFLFFICGGMVGHSQHFCLFWKTIVHFIAWLMSFM